MGRAIWWLTRDEIETIDEFGLPTWLPESLADLYKRAHTAKGFALFGHSSVMIAMRGWPNGALAAHLRRRCVGVVVERSVVSRLLNLPGLVTDLHIQRWWNA